VMTKKSTPRESGGYTLASTIPRERFTIQDAFYAFPLLTTCAECMAPVEFCTDARRTPWLKKVTVVDAIYKWFNLPRHTLVRIRRIVEHVPLHDVEESVHKECDIVLWALMRMTVAALLTLGTEITDAGVDVWENRLEEAGKVFCVPVECDKLTEWAASQVHYMAECGIVSRYGKSPLFNPTREQNVQITSFLHATICVWLCTRTRTSPLKKPDAIVCWTADIDVPPFSYEVMRDKFKECLFIVESGGIASVMVPWNEEETEVPSSPCPRAYPIRLTAYARALVPIPPARIQQADESNIMVLEDDTDDTPVNVEEESNVIVIPADI